MNGKRICAIGFLVAIAAAIVVSIDDKSELSQIYGRANISHNLVVGARLPGDRLVFRQNIIKASKWLQIVTVEQIFNVSKYEKITQLRALDQKTNGNGATASLLKGGPGTSNVTLRFKSLRGHGINFVVELYAR